MQLIYLLTLLNPNGSVNAYISEPEGVAKQAILFITARFTRKSQYRLRQFRQLIRGDRSSQKPAPPLRAMPFWDFLLHGRHAKICGGCS